MHPIVNRDAALFSKNGNRLSLFRYKLFSLFFTVVVVAAACSSSEPEEVAESPEQEYLAGLREIIDLRIEAFDRFEQLLGPVFPTFATDEIQNFVLLNALRDEDLPGIIAQASEMVLALDPPEEYAEDHARITSRLADQRDRANELAAAIEEGNLPKIHLLKAETESALQILAGSFPPDCSADLSQARASTQARCAGEDIPGGEYGMEIERVIFIHRSEFGPRAGLSAGLSDEQLMEALSYVQPAIVEEFDATIERMNAITPPAEFEVGHQVMLDFYTELRSTAFAIDRAVAAGDAESVLREFARSQEIADTALSRIPDNYRPLVNLAFGPQ